MIHISLALEVLRYKRAQLEEQEGQAVARDMLVDPDVTLQLNRLNQIISTLTDAAVDSRSITQEAFNAWYAAEDILDVKITWD